MKKGQAWEWGELQQEAFKLSKVALTNAPVRAYAIPGRGYRIYSDACDFGIAAILQQIQPIAIKDLFGTRHYDKLKAAFDQGESIPQLVISISNSDDDVPNNGNWASNFEDTVVYIERVIAYWSRTLKSAERNYSPTEREALALKDGLVKFQPFVEGEKVIAITDHAALIWSKTYQNVNRRLLTWGTIFAAFPNLKIVHRAGRVHSNVDPISRLRRRIPFQEGPISDSSKPVTLNTDLDPGSTLYTDIAPDFEDRVLGIATDSVMQEMEAIEGKSEPKTLKVQTSSDISNHQLEIEYETARNYNILISIHPQEIKEFLDGYREDSYFQKVLSDLSENTLPGNSQFPQYSIGEHGLIYFKDADDNLRVCVPKSKRNSILSEIHDSITEAAHSGYHRTYNRIAANYYWPRMSREIKEFVTSCDICQKAKPRRHAPFGLLNSIPIPINPFEVISMDFIPELPLSNGFDNILVIVDKLTKYGIFIPTKTNINEEETAQLIFKHVICQYGLPRQIISDRDSRWTGLFWEELCKKLGITRALTTSHHPQADGQTEILNQGLEISIRAYISQDKSNWEELLDFLALSYNSTVHSATGFSPAYLLRGFEPQTPASLLAPPRDSAPKRAASEEISAAAPAHHGNVDAEWTRDTEHVDVREPPTEIRGATEIASRAAPRHEIRAQPLDERAARIADTFEANRQRARDVLAVGQSHQRKQYNRGHIHVEFEEGDEVLINPHSLELLKQEKGRGRKFLMKYDGPFEIIRKISPITYQLRLPESYGIHPVINIAHLEPYIRSPDKYGERVLRHINRLDFTAQPEYEVESIIQERTIKGRTGRRIKQYKTRFIGYSADFDEWLTKNQLRNAPEILNKWEKSQKNHKRI